MSPPCPFCAPDDTQVFHRDELTIGLWDRYPVNPGHALLVTRRHVATWFDATTLEQAALLAAVATARSAIEATHRPEGYNLGVNIGEAAGQTVPHLHLHVIPRYSGDVEDPRGGVRHVIPARGNYVQDSAASATRVAETGLQRWLTGAQRSARLIRGEDDPLLVHLKGHLEEAKQADLAVAFVLRSGVAALEDWLVDLIEQRDGRLRLLTGDSLGITDPDALAQLVDLTKSDKGQRNVELRVFESRGMSFHPKCYIFQRGDADGIAYVGSSNLTGPALTKSVEWNYKVVMARDHAGFGAVVDAFETLFNDPRTRPLDEEWITAYRQRRKTVATPAATGETGLEPEPPAEPPTPHAIQEEALEALTRTREAGNAAGLVVMATGLGKTWLAAFDAVRFQARRVLFVAHRDEILQQALRTFRIIRPEASFGLYTGQAKAPDADVLFASVQTLSRIRNLRQFSPSAFDYIVVDEFHHAAARTYRRLIDHFEPAFLLGLTATPERTDGGDLLTLCGENLAYRCDLFEGIRRAPERLVPFRYFGVPDEVDYSNIPWRSSRFDEEELTRAVATQARAENALEQWRRRAGDGSRTLAFCCSTRHADFMADFFQRAGLEAAAVHTGPNAAPRADSLERLRRGDLDILCAVDILNEGVDLPAVDTVMMLRPTESRLLWLQQIGRGLRRAEGKTHLTVVDYIGNHRTFLLKPQTLLQLDPGQANLERALNLLQSGDLGELDLPEGCEVTYELEALELLRSQLQPTRATEDLRRWYEDFRERHGQRPRAVEAYHEDQLRTSPKKAYGSWLRFVRHMGDCSEAEARLLDDDAAGAFLDALETTPMTRSYKMLVLDAMLKAGRLPGSIAVDELSERVARQAARSAAVRADLTCDPGDRPALRQLLVQNPLAAWTGAKGAKGRTYFAQDEKAFRTSFDIPSELRAELAELVAEIVEWRLAAYLHRGQQSLVRFTVKVNHNAQGPMLMPLEREANPAIPTGWTEVEIDGTPHEANFVMIAVNVVRRPGETENVLPEILRAWFGENAGASGTNHRVAFESTGDVYRMVPSSTDDPAADGPQLWKPYMRAEIPALLGLPYKQNR